VRKIELDSVIPVLTFVALLAAWNIFLYKQSGGRAWSPLWMAFSTTAAAVLFLVAGTIGSELVALLITRSREG